MLAEKTFFENIVNSQEPAHLCQYRNAYISEEDLDRVTTTKGEFSDALVTGSGDSVWYFYHTLDGRHVFVINIGDKWSWQLGRPGKTIGVNVNDDLWSWEDMPQLMLPQLMPQPTFLQRSCTPFDCHCKEQGLRECSTYNSCCKCYKDFDNCICK